MTVTTFFGSHEPIEPHPVFRQLILTRLQELGFQVNGNHLCPANGDKEVVKRLHQRALKVYLESQRGWLCRHADYLGWFANGDEVVPEKIEPVLVEVDNQHWQNLFRFGQMLWSIPLSKGYGRRLRFLVIDKWNNRLIGLLGLQSPPFSWAVRDRLFSYPPDRKTEMINQTMDVYTLGAVPPYSHLLGGKLVALVAASNEVRQAYSRKYGGTGQQTRTPHLVALTTTSAFGRSSLYNRLKYRGMLIAESIGYTAGYGSFHLVEFWPLLREFCGFVPNNGRGPFQSGTRPRWKKLRAALEKLGLPGEFLHHGVKREAFLFPLVENLKDYLEGRARDPVYRDLPLSDLVAWWRERWLLPRAERKPEWRTWDRSQILAKLGLPHIQLPLF